jgi:hypothetical protein
LAFSIEPQWMRNDVSTGERTLTFGAEFKLKADTELIADRLFLGFNLLYEIEAARPVSTGLWDRESTFGTSAALVYRPLPNLILGGEADYFRRYEGLDLRTFKGEALFIGPTFYWKAHEHASLSAAWGTQVSGRSVDEPEKCLDLQNFSRHRAKLKLVLEW